MAGRIVVLGNGPSLAELELPAITIPTIGMNAAYRAWDRLGWTPDYYICLDHRLILSHVDYILASSRAGRFRQMFLAGSILDQVPHLADDPSVFFLDQYSDYWWEQFGSKHGLVRRHSPYFESPEKNLLTTGSYAIRWAAKLGFLDIGLAGIDCRYVDLPEWKMTGEAGIGLELTATPKKNPNYFFADYQMAGDRFNIPNPDRHGINLHLEAVRQAFIDLRSIDPAVRISNLSAESEIHLTGMLPYRAPSSFLGAQSLGSLAIPLTAGEFKSALNNVCSWINHARLPATGKVGSKPVLIFSFNGIDSPSLRAEVEGLKSTYPELLSYFSDIVAHFCNLSGTKDLYIRKPEGPAPEHGFKSGPNWLFYETMKYARQFGGFCLFMEVDCRPLVPNWLSTLEDVAMRNTDKLVLGSRYRGQGSVRRSLSRHVNGNALYHVGSTEFWQWLDGVLWPWLCEAVSSDYPSLAYDCAWEAYVARAELDDERHEGWPTVWAYDDKIAAIPEIVNVGGAAEGRGELRWGAPTVRSRFPRAVLVHGPVNMYASNALAVRITPFQGVGQASVSKDRATMAGHTGRGSFSLVVFSMLRERFLAGDVIDLRFTLTCSGTRRVQAALVRHGTTPAELTSHFTPVQKPFVKDIVLTHTVQTDVPEFRLQLGAVDDEEDVNVEVMLADLTVKVLRNGDEFAQGAGFMEDKVVLEEWRRNFEILGRNPERARILLIDATEIGGGTATGEIKLSFLSQLRASVLHIHWSVNGELLASYGLVDDTGRLVMQRISLTESALDSLVDAYRPSALLYRPVERRLSLARFALKMLSRFNGKSVLWMMDDWPAASWFSASEDEESRDLLEKAIAAVDARWAISPEMAEAYGARYGCTFKVIRNGISAKDVEESHVEREPLAGRHVLLRYSGGLAPNMNADAIYKIALAVEDMPDVKFEIRTHVHWWKQEQVRYADLRTSIEKIDAESDYKAWLGSADILVMAYNFDEDSLKYTRYSFANKYPELLLAGRPVLYFGPGHISTALQIQSDGIADMVTVDDVNAIRDAIKSMLTRLARWDSEGQKTVALKAHNRQGFLEIFKEDLSATLVSEATGPSAPETAAVLETA